MSKKSTFSRSFFAFSLVFSIGIAACDRAETGTGRTTEMRCLTDGLCWNPVGKRSFEGAYRRADNEIKFDAIFSPGRSAMTSFRDEWSYRLIDRFGYAFYTAHSSSPPNSWITPEALDSQLPSGIDDQAAYLDERAELAKEMAQAVINAESPGGHLQEPWNELCRHLKIKYLEEEPIVTNSASENSETDYGQTKKETSTEEVSEDDEFDIDQHYNEEQEDGMSNPEDERDENEAKRESKSKEEILATEETGENPSKIKLPRISRKFSAKFNKKTHPAEYKNIVGMEFQQELDLYWKHTRSLLVAGWKTGKHHSAACIRVYSRALGSNDRWKEINEVCTENHGTKARSGAMMLYARCRNLPVTKEFYAWKGECGGKYPTHVCNDDTALQIRHAYGEWDGGSKCLKRKRMHRPWCEKPW